MGLVVLALLAAASVVFTPTAARAAGSLEPAATAGLSQESGEQALDAYGKLPLSFVPNAGQTDQSVRYLAQGSGFSFFFTEDKAVLSLAKGERGQALELNFLGSSPDATLEAGHRAPGTVNYLTAGESHTNLPTYEQLTYRELWPGIDMVFAGRDGSLKYEFHLAPGADPSDIRLGYAGADGLSVNGDGALLVDTPLGALTDSAPTSYQHIDGGQAAVESRYALEGHSYGFALGSYDRSQALVIDPSLAYSTFLGGSGIEFGRSVAVDALGNAYVTGDTDSADFPTTAGAFDTTLDGFRDAFVTKLSPTGSSLVYSTYLGGSGADSGTGVTVDAAGSAYVTGDTNSADFPTTVGAFDTTSNGGSDAFVTKLSPTGTSLDYSTYLGGSTTDFGTGVTVDAAGSAYVTGQTNSANFPTTAGAFDTTFNFTSDAFVTKLSPTGSGLLYSTYLGGFASDNARGVAVDTLGSAYVTGQTNSANFPTTVGAFDTTLDGFDAFVTKLSPTGSGLVYSTYVGGSGADSGDGVAVDAAGSAYVTGGTTSADFPTTAGAFDTTSNGGSDAFVTKVSPTGSSLDYSTYLGGSSTDFGLGVAVDAAGSAYVTGRTDSANFPTTADAFDTTSNGGSDAFVTKVSSTGSSLDYSTYLGGSSVDLGRGVAVDASGNAYVTGNTGSTNFPTTAGAFDTTVGFGDAFVTKISFAGPGAPATLTLAPPADTNEVATQHCVTATVKDAAGNPTPGITVRFTVTGSVTTSGSDTTDANGEATFCYQGPTAPGTDAIIAFADTDTDTTQDPGEPFAAASKVWVPGPPTTLTLAPPGDTNEVATQHCVTATVKDAAGNPVPNVVVRFTVIGSVNTSGSDTTDANGEATFCYQGPTVPGTDAISAFADTDNDNTQDPGEPFAAASKLWVPGPPTTLTLSPAADTNDVGTQHCVTATVKDAAGNPVPNVVVRFTVIGSVNTSGSDTTDANGEATFCYQGPAVPGTDAISAFADTDNDTTQDPGEPSGTASKVWKPPVTTPLCEANITKGGRITAINGDKATFGGNAQSNAAGNVKGQQQYQDHGPAQPLKVKSIKILALTCNPQRTEATIFGHATINGQGSHWFRIDVEDLGEPGVGIDTYRIRLDTGYDSGSDPGSKTLQGGNIQIH